MVALKEADGLASEAVLRYLNRASDLAFAMARFADVDDPELFEGRDGGERWLGRPPAAARATPTTSRSRAATAS